MRVIEHEIPILGTRRETAWLVILLVIATQVASSLFLNAVVFQGRPVAWLLRVHAATGGLVEPNLIANLVPLVFVVGVMIFVVGRLRPGDVGWIRSKIVPALVVTAGLWMLAQLIGMVIAGWGEGRIALHDAWSTPGPGVIVGGLLGQALGNALAEETVFRGFLFPQLFFKFRRRLGRIPAAATAGVLSQLTFAALHLPNRLFVKDVDGMALVSDQVALLIGGLLFLAIYAVTKNLFVAVGLHVIVNDPAPIVEATRGTEGAVWLTLMVLLTLTWPIARKLVSRRTAHPGNPGTSTGTSTTFRRE